ncbi:uncharacterized protein PRD47_000681 [Ara ararauna]
MVVAGAGECEPGGARAGGGGGSKAPARRSRHCPAENRYLIESEHHSAQASLSNSEFIRKFQRYCQASELVDQDLRTWISGV